MTKKEELKVILDEKGISYDEKATIKELENLLPKEPESKPEPKKELAQPELASEPKKDDDKFIVKDPQVLRPQELPLVIEPNDGKWKNKEQAEFATVLNAYAYKNSEKWKKKREVLLKRLAEIGKNPDAIIKYRGNRDKVSFKNKLFEN